MVTGEVAKKGGAGMAGAPEPLTTPARFGRFASFVAFFSTLLVYSPNMMALRGSDSGDLTGFFAEPLLAATFSCSLVLAIIAALPSKARPQPRLGQGTAITLIAMTLYLAGGMTFSLAMLLQPGSVGPFLCVAAALVQAVALIPTCVAWGGSLADLGLARAVLLVALTSAASAVCNVILKVLGDPVAQVTFPLLTLCGLVWPALKLLKERADAGSTKRSEDEPAEDRSRDSKNEPCVVRPFLSVMGVPLLGMAISSFAMGVQPGLLFNGTVDAQHLGMFVGAACLIPLALGRATRGRRPLFAFAYQLYLPACSAVAIVLCSFPAGGFVRECGLAAAYAFYAMVSAVGVAAGIAASNTGEFPRTLMLSSLAGVFCGAGILGVSLGARFDALVDNRLEVLAALTAAYGCWLMLAGCARSWHLTVSPHEDADIGAEAQDERHPSDHDRRDGGKTGAYRRDSLEASLAALAEQGRLSPRETEVLGFVGRGHSSVYAAKTLLVSESTVYTHVRSIYRKLGIRSREELLSLLENGRAGALKDGAGNDTAPDTMNGRYK